MSTYEIREALEALKTRALAEGNGLLMEQHARATLAVEAIERAAKAISAGPGNHGPTERSEAFIEAVELMESIAKDAA